MEALTKKHDGFEKALHAQEEKITTLNQLADALLAQDHYAEQQIKDRRAGVLDRNEKIAIASAARRERLEDSKNYQILLKNIFEVLISQVTPRSHNKNNKTDRINLEMFMLNCTN